MGDVVWPIDLPDCSQTWEEKDNPDVVITEMETGHPKKRRRSLVQKTQINVSWVLKPDQYVILMEFFRTDTQDGVKTFDYSHPLTKAVNTYRFIDSPSITMIQGDNSFGTRSVTGVNVSATFELII